MSAAHTAAVLRPLRPQDAPAAQALDHAASAHPWTLRQWQDSIAAGHWTQGLYADGALIACCAAMSGYGEAHLLNIAVAPAHQGQGHARHLLTALAQWAQHAQTPAAECLWLEVRQGNARAQHLYARSGFIPVHVRRAYYPAPALPGGREDAVVMRLPLFPASQPA